LHASIENEDRDAYEPKTGQKPHYKYESLRESADNKRARIPAIAGRARQQSEMSVDPNVGMF